MNIINKAHSIYASFMALSTVLKVVLCVFVFVFIGWVDDAVHPERVLAEQQRALIEKRNELAAHKSDSIRYVQSEVQKRKERIENGPDSRLVVREYLRNHLNDWDSYEGEDFIGPIRTKNHNGQRSWQVRHAYRAKNVYGGIILQSQVFAYTENGVWSVKD